MSKTKRSQAVHAATRPRRRRHRRRRRGDHHGRLDGRRVLQRDGDCVSFDLQGRRRRRGPWLDVGVPGRRGRYPDHRGRSRRALAEYDDRCAVLALQRRDDGGNRHGRHHRPSSATRSERRPGLRSRLTVTRIVGAALPSDPGCATPVTGTLQVVTTAAFPSGGARGFGRDHLHRDRHVQLSARPSA